MYDHSDSFFYCDPPYRGTEGRVTDKPFSHTEFLETLPTLSGKWLLSYGELPSVFDTGEYDHRIIDREENAGDTAIREVLVANYDMSEASFSGMNQSALTAYVER